MGSVYQAKFGRREQLGRIYNSTRRLHQLHARKHRLVIDHRRIGASERVDASGTVTRRRGQIQYDNLRARVASIDTRHLVVTGACAIIQYYILGGTAAVAVSIAICVNMCVNMARFAVIIRAD